MVGRICISCTGFRTDGGWKCLFRGAALVPRPLPTAGPRDAQPASVPERSLGVLRQTFPAIGLLGAAVRGFQEVSEIGVPSFFLSYPPPL